MIIPVEKYLIFGAKDQIDRFFGLAQRAGILEFIGLSHKKALELPEGAKKILAAMKVARQHTPDFKKNPLFYSDAVTCAEDILASHMTYEKGLEEQRMLRAEISRIAPFGAFSLAEIAEIERDGKRVLQFFCMKSTLAHQIVHPPEVIYVGGEYDLDYFVAINSERTQYPKMIEILIDKPAHELRKQLEELKINLLKTESELHDSANALPFLQNGLNEYLNEHYLALVKHDAIAPLEGSLFAIEAWVPKNRVTTLQGLLSVLAVSSERIEIEPADSIPTYIENRGVAKVGEDLLHIYDTPSPTDKDPSLWVLVFFSFFFAMITSDAGYGLLYLGAALFLRWKFPNIQASGKRFIKLLTILSCSCIVWGVLTASFFGIEIGPENPLRKTSFLHYFAVQKAEYHMEQKDDVYQEYVHLYPAVAEATDGHDFLVKASAPALEGGINYKALSDFYDNILLEFSLMVGVLHVSLSFCRYMRRNWCGFGWIVFMVGGYLFFPSVLSATSIVNFMGWVSKPVATAIGLPILYAGLIAVFIAALAQGKRWMALHEITNAVQVFGDVLSYLRLYALALAGMMMASTFNNHLGIDLGIVFTILCIIIGHTINISLSLMAGVIHGLRLNFLEWYHYSFEGGGRLFAPLRLRKVK